MINHSGSIDLLLFYYRVVLSFSDRCVPTEGAGRAALDGAGHAAAAQGCAFRRHAHLVVDILVVVLLTGQRRRCAAGIHASRSRGQSFFSRSYI